MLEPPYFQADTLKFGTVKKPIGSDDELTFHLGVEKSGIVFYSTGKTIVFGLRTFLALSYLALFDNIRAKSIFGLEICGSNRQWRTRGCANMPALGCMRLSQHGQDIARHVFLV